MAESIITKNLIGDVAALLNSLSKDELLSINKKNYSKINKYLKQVDALLILQRLLHHVLYSNEDKGYIKLDLKPFKAAKLDITSVATLLCFAAGIPFSLYKNKPYWEPLAVKLGARPNRMHGIGCNPFHIDLLTRSKPPEIIAFLGVRIDPLGGGYTELSDLLLAIKQLSSTEYELLSKKNFKYWPDNDVCHVGHHLTSYTIIPPNDIKGFVRYTAKMIPHLDGSNNVVVNKGSKYTIEIKQALENLHSILKQNALQFLIQPDELFLFNQRRFAHSRTELGKNQIDLPFNKRRLMMQAYLHKPKYILAA